MRQRRDELKNDAGKDNQTLTFLDGRNVEPRESILCWRYFEEIFLESLKDGVFNSRRMIDGLYLWCIELYSNIERKLSIRRREIVGASGCVTNEIRFLLILDRK